MPRAITIVPKPPKLEQKKRVAAYARVSSGKDAMLHSLSAQVSYYSDLIQNHDGWLYVGVYADEAKTGTKEARADFQRLIADCRAGKIDMVITKSISRFARNTVTLLQTVRDFKDWGVDVYFEEQNIHTMSGDGELMMTILASYAQEESRSASENQKWRIKHNFEEGIPWNGTILGYRIVNGKYEIVDDEAEIVRRIYHEYLSGKGYNLIAKELNADGVVSRLDGVWHPSAVSKILQNYAYTGNLLLQQTFRKNHLVKVGTLNIGQLPQYHVENSHEAIIDMELFQVVQAERTRRAEKFKDRVIPKGTYPLTGMLVCSHCGKNYRRKIAHSFPKWVCSTFNTQGKSACASKQVTEEILYREIAAVLGLETFSAELFHARVRNILVCDGNRLLFRMADGTEIERVWVDRSRSESWTDEMRAAARQKALERRK